MNLIIDGPNGIGKTTYAKSSGMKTFHHIKPKYRNRICMILYYKFAILFRHDCIFDRSWYSEWVYGNIYDGGSVLKIKDIMALNNFAKRHLCRVKIFTPKDIYATYHAMLDCRKTEKHPLEPTFNEFCKICMMYQIACELTNEKYILVNFVKEHFKI